MVSYCRESYCLTHFYFWSERKSVYTVCQKNPFFNFQITLSKLTDFNDIGMLNLEKI